jgi:asparagine synthase (glutamine-hydrolysing)
MAAITGIIGNGNFQKYNKQIKIMTDCTSHENWYRNGTYIHEQLGIYAGWNMQKSTFCDCLPVMNEKKDLVLLICGECYTDRGTLHELKSKNHQFESRNASYLVHLYEEDPKAFFSTLNGRFCGLLIDLRTEKAILFNDRYGMGRIYYFEGTEEFLFSSEAKTILKIKPELRKIDPRGLGEFLTCDCVLENRTLFNNIFLFPGGSAWTFHAGKVEKKETYFNPSEWENSEILDDETLYKNMSSTFRNILPRYFNTPPGMGLSLTGGLDTRMILANRQFAPGTLPCYTFAGMYHESRDVRVARKVAEYCSQTHHCIDVGQDFIKQFPALAEKTVFITDGGMDVSGAPELYINRLAREIAPVRITGNYGQEVFNRDRAFKAQPVDENILHKDFLPYSEDACATFNGMLNIHPLSFTVFRQAPWFHYKRLSLEQSQLILRTPFLDNDMVKCMFQASHEAASNRNLCIRLILEGNKGLAGIMTDRGLLGRSNVWSKLAKLYYELQFKAEYCYDYGMPQWMSALDHLVSPLHFERFFLGRHKFCHFRVWYRDSLSGYIKQILLDPKTLSRPYFNPGMVEAVTNGHTLGIRNHTVLITKLLTVELIQRLFID